MNLYFYVAIAILNLILPDQRNQTESQILLSWLVSCILVTIHLELLCWLIFVFAPGIQSLFELAAWLCYSVGTVSSFLIGTVLAYTLVMGTIIVAGGYTYMKLSWNEFHLTENVILRLAKVWAGAGGITVTAFLAGWLIDILTIASNRVCVAIEISVI